MPIRSNCGEHRIVKDDGTVLARVYDKGFSPDIGIQPTRAMKIAEELEKKLVPKCTGVNPIQVSFNEGIIDIYWNENSKWKYGIPTEEKAREIADYIECNVERILSCCEELPKPRNRVKSECDSYKVIKDGRLFANIEKDKFSEVFDKDDFFGVHHDDMDRHGLKSRSPKWDRSIRTDSLALEGDKIKKILYYCMRYMDENWR